MSPTLVIKKPELREVMARLKMYEVGGLATVCGKCRCLIADHTFSSPGKLRCPKNKRKRKGKA